MSIVLALVVAAAFTVLGSLYGYLRAAVGLAMFVAICYVGFRWIYGAVSSDPDPEPTDVSEYGLRYVCSVCGLELKVEVAARDKPPTHCLEPMTLIRTGGRPPLRPL